MYITFNSAMKVKRQSIKNNYSYNVLIDTSYIKDINYDKYT